MTEGTTFTSTKIAQEMARVFGAQIKTFQVTLKDREAVQTYIRKYEDAHKNAAKSKLVFRG